MATGRTGIMWKAGLAVLFLAVATRAGEGAARPEPPATLPPDLAAVSVTTELVNETTGLALSPLVVLLARGTVRYFRHDEADGPPPWDAHPVFLGLIVLVLALVFSKDLFGDALGPFKPALDSLELAVKPGGCILAYVALMPAWLARFQPAAETVVYEVAALFPMGAAHAAEGGGAAASGVFVNIVAAVAVLLFSTVVFGSVWIVSNVLDLLGLVLPGIVVAAAKAMRMAVVAVLFGLSALHPWLGFACSCVIILFCFLTAAWAFRFSLWLLSFAWGNFLRALAWVSSDAAAPRADLRPPFRAYAAGGGLLGVRRNTMGKLALEDGGPVFRYRRFLVLPRAVPLPEGVALAVVRRPARGPALVMAGGLGPILLFAFSPKYGGREAELAEALGLGAVRNAARPAAREEVVAVFREARVVLDDE